MSVYMHRPTSQSGAGMVQIPSRIARLVPVDAKFEPELTDDGLLLRFVGIVPRPSKPAPDAIAAPEWARGEATP